MCLMIRVKYRRVRLDLLVVQVSFDDLKPYFCAVFCRLPKCLNVQNADQWTSSVLCSGCCPVGGPLFTVTQDKPAGQTLFKGHLQAIRDSSLSFVCPNGHSELIKNFLEGVLPFLNMVFIYLVLAMEYWRTGCAIE